ncbi:peroxisome proliferator-activated receptor gamma coactivator-related protein 1 [Periophthalmus magnuspinnatus]|uniref:peroxisome proliferator-activated receptor gamma coactivator-related protein 1 n=1 Tax=Periophthalmus magnuspinnatus TaxID=409849 RepID=UPI0024362D76|nr:peroxisome proliferator-activated receptor gamma coactivator-related protein 1 [Periophthalmus magnuspinnatus]
MAVRWGTGEEILTTCNMDIFPLDTLDETTGLNSGDTMNTLQGCLDPTILSMFEDPSAIETRGLEEESEATLLTALTEILDNVDDENLSPFDTLPESDLLSGQKGREHSPLRRLFCLSRSPPEKETLFGKHRSTGKTLPMVQQRSDGEEEEDSLTPTPGRLELTSDNELDWEGFPITFEQNGEDGLSVSLGDLVRQMHPYCMAISLEDDEGGQMLPEGGILLEVVDQGANGEPILAIPEMDRTISVKLDESILNSKVLDEGDDEASDSSEQIVVDDDDDIIVMPQLKVAESKTESNVKDKLTGRKLEDEIKDKNLSKRKKKSSSHLAASPPEPSEGRVLRSALLKKASHEAPKKYENKLLKKDKRHKEKNSKLQDPTATTTTSAKPKDLTVSQTKMSESTISTTLQTSSEKTGINQSVSPPVLQSEPAQTPLVTAPEQQTAAPTASEDKPAVPIEEATPEVCQSTTVVGLQSPLLPSVTAEPKPKALSLAEYRRLRQQKKPAPVEKQDDNSTKWPSLPEPPRELPPIPHLPEPRPRDPRLSRSQSKEVEEVKPAWMPRGPGAPPTPEALLAPPAYMVNSGNKAATKPQQTAAYQHNQNTTAPHIHTKDPTKDDPSSVTTYQSPPSSATTTTEEIKPAANVLTSVSQNAAASTETKAKVNPTDAMPKSSEPCGQNSSSPVTHLKLVNQSSSGKAEESPAVKPLEAKSPTQELIEAFSSEMGIEASDLTSLLEQFEETQAKEDQCLPEVSGRAVAVGNSSNTDSEKIVVERVRANDLSVTALTPPATPPHPLWKPLAPVSLLGKSKAETKSVPSRVIEIEAQPLPLAKARSRLTSAASVDPDLACQDHDYCLPNKGTSCGETAKRWNVKQHSSITIKPIKQTATLTLQNAEVPTVQSAICANKAQELDQKYLEKSSVLETPDASPARDEDDNKTCPKRRQFVRSYRQRASSRSPNPKERSVGRSRVRRSHCSSSSRSDSSESSRSRSRSCSPPRKRYRPRHSRSSSSSTSRSTSRSSSRSQSPPRRRRYSYSSSRSASWSRSRSRSRSPQWSKKRQVYSPSYRDSYYTNVKTNPELKRRKEKAIEERRVVYVGRIRGTMTQKELKERFSYFGEIEECTLHFRDQGDNYGFVTYYNTNNAFMAIENGSKLRKPDEMPFDLCFGGRRQFCQTSYADLDSSKEYEPLPSRNKYHALDFDTLLKQAQQNLKR